MKIEQLLVQHLYHHKKVSLQGIGSLTLSPDIVLPAENDKDFVLPENAIQFVYDPKGGEDNALIDFIVQQTRKIRPLASADLDSYIVLGKQFLNIGKPFRIEGVGTLEKNQKGQFEFTAGQYIQQKMEAAPAALREKGEEHISFSRPEKKTINKKLLLIAGSVIVVGIVAFAGWYFLGNKKHKTIEDENNTQNTLPVKPESSPISKDSVSHKPPMAEQGLHTPSADGYQFKVVFKQFNDRLQAEAEKQKWEYRKHTVIIIAQDSSSFKLAEPFRRPLTDTAHILDSLRRYYHPKAHIEIK